MLRLLSLVIMFAAPSIASAQSMSIAKATIGCSDWDVYKQISGMFAQGDKEAGTKLYLAAAIQGICRTFEAGDAVYISEMGFTTVKVRRKGETSAFWLPIEHVRR